MLTFDEILKNIAAQPWSIEDPDFLDVASLLEDSPKLVLAAQAANSFIFRLNELPFKNYIQKYQTTAGQSEYDAPAGNIQDVFCEGNTEPLKLNTNLSLLISLKGRPNEFNRQIVNGEDKVALHPTPDNVYNISVKYETFNTAKRLDEGKYIEIPNLKEDDDVLNVPEHYEDMYLECLYAKTMVYLIIDNTDENYQPYERKFQEALGVLMKSTGLEFTKRIGFK